MKRILFIFVFILAALAPQGWAAPVPTRFHNEAADTARINDILSETVARHYNSSGERTADIAMRFIGTPYVAHTLEGDEELLTVNLEELDCTTFVETVMALSLTAGEHRTTWHDYIYNLGRLRYRGGEVNGYASRLHYISDWAIDNIHRGNFREVTSNFPSVAYLVRTIDFMTANRDKYPALADDSQFERMRSVEIGYRNHRFPYIKTSDLGKKATMAALRDGDIVALVTKMKNLDVTHMGVIIKKDGVPYLLHASSSLGKVVLTTVPLADFMKKNPSLAGIRVFRLE
ncbi:MAG: DUF1460 domain-containing protein [Muribaculaceae bacterium]|nr:DUF1460 domain-containing protein [Muribaculaceae bacterium]